jgi:hypothetical protein
MVIYNKKIVRKQRIKYFAINVRSKIQQVTRWREHSMFAYRVAAISAVMPYKIKVHNAYGHSS